MPALVKSSVGSPSGTSEELGRTRCPRSAKKRRNSSRISLPASATRGIYPTPPQGAGAVALSDDQPRPAAGGPCGRRASPADNPQVWREALDEVVVGLGVRRTGRGGRGGRVLGAAATLLEVVPGAVGRGRDAAEAQRE